MDILICFFMTISMEIMSETEIQSFWTFMISALVVSVTTALIISGSFLSHFGYRGCFRPIPSFRLIPVIDLYLVGQCLYLGKEPYRYIDLVI